MNLPPTQIDPGEYQKQLDEKRETIEARFAALGAPSPQIFASPPAHYRMRAEFRIWHEKDHRASRCYYAMFDPDQPRQPIEITGFPIASRGIYELMSPLMDDINSDIVLNQKLFQIEFLSSTLEEIVVTLIYHRQLDQHWEQRAALLQEKYGISIIGRARKQKLVLARDFVNEKLTAQGREYHYEQRENSFTQPNAAINTAMINWCCDYLKQKDRAGQTALLEMYCGNGNFTIPLAQYFDKVLATEIAKTSIASAKKNARSNHVNNIEFVRLSGEETAQALDGLRPFRRLADIDLASYHFDTVFVDPPRSGLDKQTLGFIERFDEILYISCNPDTLAENLEVLTATHKIEKFAIFDQFPYTPHCECGVVLKRKKGNGD